MALSALSEFRELSGFLCSILDGATACEFAGADDDAGIVANIAVDNEAVPISDPVGGERGNCRAQCRTKSRNAHFSNHTHTSGRLAFSVF